MGGRGTRGDVLVTISTQISRLEITLLPNYQSKWSYIRNLPPFIAMLCLSLGRIYGEQRATYESASLRMFQLGRTDTIRSASVESSVFVRAMDSPQEQVLGPLKCHIPFANKAFWGKEVSNNLNCTLEFMSWTIMSTRYKVG